MKRIISLLTIVSMLVVMVVSCTPNGAPLSLVGVWKLDNEGSDNCYEFTDKDEFKIGTEKNRVLAGKITKATCNEITIKAEGSSTETTYKYELSCDSLRLTNSNPKYSGSTMNFKKL